MLTYSLEKGPVSLYEQLYVGIRRDIESGRIVPGERLPSKRQLARHLNVSVITVEGAYDQLVAEGYVRAEARRGYFACEVECVSPGEGVAELQVGDEARLQAYNATALQVSDPIAPRLPALADLTGAQQPQGLFPYAAWARTMRAVLSNETEETLQQAAHPRGAYALRLAIVEHLRGFRGMEILPDQIVVGAGAQTLYALLVQLLGRDRVFAIENPGYKRLQQIYLANDVACVPVALDDAGPGLDELVCSGASVLHCMPSHQFPTGITTPVGRRRELLAWAAGAGAAPAVPAAPAGAPELSYQVKRYLIEDDFDCEFRMTGRPMPSLQSMDAHESVIYTNTFTKTLGAAFRIGYMVLPRELSRKFDVELGFYNCTVGALEQLTLARFMKSGDYERHVNRQRTHFRRVQNALLRALDATEAGALLRPRQVGAGLHFVLEVDTPCDAGSLAAAERKIVEAAGARGLTLSPLSGFWLAEASAQRSPISNKPQFMINFTALEEDGVQSVAKALSDAVLDAVETW